SAAAAAPTAVASRREAPSAEELRGSRKSPSPSPTTRPPAWPQLSTPDEPRPTAKSASNQGSSRRPKCLRRLPETPRRQPNEADAPSMPKATPEAPSETESAPSADAIVVPSAVKKSAAR